MITRVGASITLGAVVTVALLFTMQRMITMGESAIPAPEGVLSVDFVRVERAEPVEARATKPERPPAPAVRPGLRQPALAGDAAATLTVGVTPPQFDVGAQVSSGFESVGDADYRPIVKVAPVYPAPAVVRRLEGSVIVAFTVTAEGTVRDVVVVESTDALFEASAIEAARGFRYRPRIISGVPVEVDGVRNRIVFVMDEPQRMAMER